MPRRGVDRETGKAATSILAVRLSSRQRDLIERAAHHMGVRPSEYVRENAMAAAQQDLLSAPPDPQDVLRGFVDTRDGEGWRRLTIQTVRRPGEPVDAWRLRHQMAVDKARREHG